MTKSRPQALMEAWQNYINLISGATKATRERATATARTLLAQAGLEDVANNAGERVNKLADEIVSASKANRNLLESTISNEVERVAGRLGYVRGDEVDALRAEIRQLRRDLADAASTAHVAEASSTTAPGAQEAEPSEAATPPNPEPPVVPGKRTSAKTPGKKAAAAAKTAAKKAPSAHPAKTAKISAEMEEQESSTSPISPTVDMPDARSDDLT